MARKPIVRKGEQQPLVINGGSDGIKDGGSSRVRRGVTAVAGTTASIAGGYAASEVLSRIQELDPDLAARLEKFASENGLDLTSLAKAGAESANMLLDLVARKLNMNPAHAGEFGLSRKEELALRKLADKHYVELVDAHDEYQLELPSSGDRVVDDAALFHGMANACQRLGLVGASRFRMLYAISLSLNSITENVVERVEQHESLYGPITSR